MSEVLLRNRLDEDFQDVFAPFNILNWSFLQPKFCLRDNYLTPNGVLYNIISCIGSASFAMVFFMRIIIAHNFENIWDTFILAVLHFDLFMYGTGFLINFISNFLSNIKYVKMVLKLHKVHKMRNPDKNFKSFARFNWIYVLLLYCYFIFGCIIISVLENR